jgi:hypothetical protein
MARGVTDRWPDEPIPDEDPLYRWVHRQWFSTKHGGVSPTFFKNASDPMTGRAGISTDWNRYWTTEDARQRARDPAVNAVIEMTVGGVRAIPDQIVEHTPIQNHPDPYVRDNRAHADVFGPKEEAPEIQRTFARICRVVIPVPQP